MRKGISISASRQAEVAARELCTNSVCIAERCSHLDLGACPTVSRERYGCCSFRDHEIRVADDPRARDPAGRMIASAPGFDFSGSADDLISVAVGDGHLRAPLILVAIQAGGHRENTIFLAIYRVHRGKNLERLFLAPIEEHEGMETVVGSITFVPSGIVYRAPRSPTASRWTFDVHRQRYIEQGRIEPSVVLPST